MKNLLEIRFTIASFETGKGGERVEVNEHHAQRFAKPKAKQAPYMTPGSDRIFHGVHLGHYNL
jgi:hypothetical protein